MQVNHISAIALRPLSRRIALAILALLPVLTLATRSAAQEEQPLQPGTHTQAVSVDGVRRSYVLHVPPSYSGKERVPLVLLLHERGGTAKSAERAYGMSEKADRERFLVAYPEAIGVERAWNTGFGAPAMSADDAAFLRALVARLERTLAVDQRRVFVAGHGNGGTMAYRLAAEFSSRIAAVGVVGATAGVKGIRGSFVTLPRPAHPVSVIAFHGKKDGSVPYESDRFLSARQTFLFWARHNDCATAAPKETLSNGAVIRETYTECGEEAEVTLYTLVEDDHRWPGAIEARPSARPTLADISATDLMWEFFAKHQR